MTSSPHRDHWHGQPLPAQRLEAHYGDRIVQCFVERPGSLDAMFAATVAQFAGHDALVCGNRRWSYAALDARVARCAAGLSALGIRRGERIALLLSNRAEFVLAFLATQRLGAISVPIGIREQRPGIAYMLAQCSARAVVCDGELSERIPDRAESPMLEFKIVCMPQLAGKESTDPRSIAFDSIVERSGVRFAGSDEPRAANASNDATAAPSEEDTAIVLYTSGTTGQPKGAMLTHLSVLHSALHFKTTMNLTDRDRTVLAVPVSHVTGLIANLISMLAVGGATVMLPNFKAGDFLALAAGERMTHTVIVPAMYQLCLLEPDLDRHDLSAWRVGAFGGAPMPATTIDALAARLPGLMLQNAYGATETSSPATVMPAGHTREHVDSVGVPVPCADIVVVDDEGHELPIGETGEIWIGGPMVARGYWNDPEATAREFTAGFWHSGDLGSIDAQGYLRVFDRKKDMLIRGGFKIFSVEVENTLLAFAGVTEAAVIGRPCPVLGERVHAVVCMASNAALADVTAQTLQAHCAVRLADYKVPETFTIDRAPLPRNANGKVLKRALRETLG